MKKLVTLLTVAGALALAAGCQQNSNTPTTGNTPDTNAVAPSQTVTNPPAAGTNNAPQTP